MTFDYQLINGEIVPTAEALIPLSDLGLLRSYSVFDFFGVHRGVPVFFEDHLGRLAHSMDVMDLNLRWSQEEIAQMCLDLIRKNTVDVAGLRVHVTGGFSPDGYTLADPNIFMMLHEWPNDRPDMYENGVKVISSSYLRDIPSVKTTIYVQSVHYQSKMRHAGAYEVMYHWKGNITECSRSNVFFVDQDGKIHTPKDGMLKGITRKQVIGLAEGKFELMQRPVSIDEIPQMSEAFLTSTTKGVLPIVKIDDLTVGNGAVGPVARELKRAFDAHHEAEIQSRRAKLSQAV